MKKFITIHPNIIAVDAIRTITISESQPYANLKKKYYLNVGLRDGDALWSQPFDTLEGAQAVYGKIQKELEGIEEQD